MASESQIKSEIERTAALYSFWMTGLTNEPAHCRIEHGSPKTWYQWHADTETAARNIERHFITKGMKAAPSNPSRADYVYIFRRLDKRQAI
ncbi:hypothetical protein ACFLTO_04150 [Chloroflexota bacterium]